MHSIAYLLFLSRYIEASNEFDHRGEFYELAFLGAMLYISASRATALREGILWVPPSSRISNGLWEVTSSLTRETHQQSVSRGIAWFLLSVLVLYARISLRFAEFLPSLGAAMLLSILPQLLPHRVYAQCPITGVFICMLYLRLCERAAIQYGLVNGNIEPTWIYFFVAMPAFYCLFLSIWAMLWRARDSPSTNDTRVREENNPVHRAIDNLVWEIESLVWEIESLVWEIESLVLEPESPGLVIEVIESLGLYLVKETLSRLEYMMAVVVDAVFGFCCRVVTLAWY